MAVPTKEELDEKKEVVKKALGVYIDQIEEICYSSDDPKDITDRTKMILEQILMTYNVDVMYLAEGYFQVKHGMSTVEALENSDGSNTK